MSRQADLCNTKTTIEALRLEVVLQMSKVHIAPPAVNSSLETKLLVAMQQNLEIMMTNQSINLSQGI